MLPIFDRRHSWLLAVLALLFTTGVALRLNGWSMGIWHRFIDGSSPSEVLLGQPRDVRGDDFLLDLGLTLAQEKARPQFPVVNPNFGADAYIAAPICVPAGVLGTCLRPFTWGFVLFGSDAGLAWKWWGLTLGLFYGLFLVFLLVSGNRFWLSVAASVAMVYSPFFQFWSLHKAEIAIHWSCTVVAIAVILAARRRWVIATAGVAAGLSATALFLDHLYPPIAVPLAWLIPFTVGAWLFDARATVIPRFREQAGRRVAALLLGVALWGALLGLFWWQGREGIAAIRDTVYPGRRFSLGGSGMPAWAFFSHSFFAQGWSYASTWFLNICEQGSFFYFFPLTLALTAVAAIRRRAIEPWNLVLAAYVAVMLVYTFIGFPAWLSRITLMGMSSSGRTGMGLGLANQMMLVAACSRVDWRAVLSPAFRGTAAILWVAGLGCAAAAFQHFWPGIQPWQIALGLGFQALLAALFWLWTRPVAAMAALAAVSVAYTAWFNPLARGGTDFVLHNPLSQEIRTLYRADHSQHRWVVFGDVRLCHLPQMIGAPGIGGYRAVPDFATWKKFDPSGSSRAVYNQCAFTVFTAAPTKPARFVPESAGFFIIEADPTLPAFAACGVRFYLAANPDTAEVFRRTGAFRQLFTYAGKTIFERR